MIPSIGTIHTKRKSGARISWQFVHKSLRGKELLAAAAVVMAKRPGLPMSKILNASGRAALRNVQENERQAGAWRASVVASTGT
jgi:hypothetical protein